MTAVSQMRHDKTAAWPQLVASARAAVGLNLQLSMRKQVPVVVLAIIVSVSLFLVHLSKGLLSRSEPDR